MCASAAGSMSLADRRAMTPSELCELTAVTAVGAMRRGDIAAETYAAALLGRCQAYSALNAFISLEPERVLDSARGADLLRRSGRPLGLLHGLPLPVKDSINSLDLPTSAGTAALRGFRPTVLQSLLSAGALLHRRARLPCRSVWRATSQFAVSPLRSEPRCYATPCTPPARACQALCSLRGRRSRD
jgi:hypothetical protein